MASQFQKLAQVEIIEINLYIHAQLIFSNNAKIINGSMTSFSINGGRTTESPYAKYGVELLPCDNIQRLAYIRSS